MNEQKPEQVDWLQAKGLIMEEPFHSDIPVLGAIVVWLRTRWLNMAARWYIRPMMAQQNEFNRLLVERVRRIESHAVTLTSEHDRDLLRLQHDMAALHYQIKQLNNRLRKLDAMLPLDKDEFQEAGGE